MFHNYIPGFHEKRKGLSLDSNIPSFINLEGINYNPYKMQFSILSTNRGTFNNNLIISEISFQIPSYKCSVNCYYCFKKENIIKNLGNELCKLGDNCNILLHLIDKTN
jgi:hypothetical protein